MDSNKIKLKKTAIVYFDMLNGYFQGLDKNTKARKKPMVENAARIMNAARTAGIPIYFAQGSYRADRSDAPLLVTDTTIGLKPWPNGRPSKEIPRVVGGAKSSKIISQLNPRRDDYYVPKYRWNAFYQTSLDLLLRARGIDTVIISGGSTDVGIAATVFGGRDLDYNIIVVRDACATNHRQQAHDTLMDFVFPRMSRVRTTDQVVQMIKQAVRR